MGAPAPDGSCSPTSQPLLHVVSSVLVESERRYRDAVPARPYEPPAVTIMSVTNPAARPSITPQYSNSIRPTLRATPRSWITT